MYRYEENFPGPGQYTEREERLAVTYGERRKAKEEEPPCAHPDRPDGELCFDCPRR